MKRMDQPIFINRLLSVFMRFWSRQWGVLYSFVLEAVRFVYQSQSLLGEIP